MIYSFIDAIYWMALSGWFGAVLVSALVWPVIHKTIVDADPTLPLILHSNLDKQHGTLLAGNVVGAVLKMLFRLELICAIVFLPLLGIKWFLVDKSQSAILIPLLVTGLYLLSTAFLVYGMFFVYPKVISHRQKYLDNADNPDIANAELDHFDRYSTELISIVRNLLFSVMGIVLFSPFMHRAIQTFVAG